MWGSSRIETAHGGGRALVRFGRPTDFLIGVDNPFIKLSNALRLGARARPPRVAEIDSNLLIELGILGSTHLVDCGPDDPSQFRFLQYGSRIAIHDGREYSGRTLKDAEWPLIRHLAERDYGYAKSNAAVTLAQIELLWHGRQIVYRRLIVPLAGDRGEVTHLLVATRPNLLQVVPSSFD